MKLILLTLKDTAHGCKVSSLYVTVALFGLCKVILIPSNAARLGKYMKVIIARVWLLDLILCIQLRVNTGKLGLERI